MNKKRILFSAYAFYPDFGGLEQQIYLLAQEYLKQGHVVDVLTEKTRPNLPSKEIIDGITVYRMPHQAKRTVFSYFSLIFHLSKFIIFHAHNYDLVILRAALTLYPLVFGFWKFFGLVPSPTWTTADTGGEQDEVISIRKWPFHRTLLFFFNQHTYLNSICDANYEHYLSLGFPSKKLTRIGNGVDVSKYETAQYPQKVSSFLFIARLYRIKGTRETLEAFYELSKKYKGVELHIGGDGPETTYIKNFIAEKKLENRIFYHGVITNETKDEFYTYGECLVLPSYSEGFGLVYAEAAVRKKMIIATSVADLEKLFGSTVYFCKPKDAKSVFQAMEKVVTAENFFHISYDAIIPQIDIKKIASQILKQSLSSY